MTLGERRVLNAVSFDFDPGKVTALIAPSGAGKSTLLRAIVRLIAIDGGKVTLGGQDVAEIEAPALRKRVGLVAQTPAMLPGTVADNLAYGLDSPDEADLLDALRTVGLDRSFAERPAKELSGGERARVAMARALTRSPEFLLLDEPTAALDEDAAHHVDDSLKQLAAQGIGIVVATHDDRIHADSKVTL